jgi:hypothetical protein
LQWHQQERPCGRDLSCLGTGSSIGWALTAVYRAHIYV